MAGQSWKWCPLSVVRWFPKSVSTTTLTTHSNGLTMEYKDFGNQSAWSLRWSRPTADWCVDIPPVLTAGVFFLRLWECTAVWRERPTCCCPRCRPCRRRLNIWSTTWAPRLASNWTCSRLWATPAGSWRSLKIKWWGRTGRSRRWSRRSRRWWPSVPPCPTWRLGLRCRSISPSYSALSATCWIHERWCTSVWRSEGGRRTPGS